MIRRDYLFRMVDECLQVLTRSLRLREEGQLEAARAELDGGIRDLTGMDLAQILLLSDAELTALLVQGGPTQVLRQKGMLLVALLRGAGDNLRAESRTEESRQCYLRALNLQLQILTREGLFDFPEFVPRVEELAGELSDEALPLETGLGLLQYYEQAGAFAKAEDALFALMEAHSERPGLAAFGIQFYERVLRQSDEALERGQLPRSEVEAGLVDFRRQFMGAE
jgi:hypothetical protein